MRIKGLLERVGKALPGDEPVVTLWSTFRKQNCSKAHTRTERLEASSRRCSEGTETLVREGKAPAAGSCCISPAGLPVRVILQPQLLNAGMKSAPHARLLPFQILKKSH